MKAICASVNFDFFMPKTPRTALAPWPASDGPFFTLDASQWPSIRGGCSGMVKRAVPLDGRVDRRPVEAGDQVSLPVTGHHTVGGLGGPLANHELGRDDVSAAPARREPAAAGRCAARPSVAAAHLRAASRSPQMRG